MTKLKTTRSLLLACTALSMFTITSATAQSVVDEIIVTARKKTETLKEVPIAVNVTTGDEIQELALRDLQAVITTVPAVNLSKGGAGAFINIRGVGSGENSGFEQSVGYVIDGVNIGRSRATRAGIVDLEQVEVLKGPQTTYFGANTIAGVINLRTTGASLDDGVSGYGVTSYEFETEEKVIEGAVNIPVSDNFAIRLAGKYSDSEGFVANEILGNKVPAIDDNLVRGSALWAPTDAFKAEVKFTHAEMDANSGLDTQLVNCRPGGPAQFNCIQVNGNPVNDVLDDISNFDLPESRSLDLDMVSANLSYDFGVLTLSSISGYYEFDNEFLVDLDVSSVPSLVAPSRFALSQLDTAESWSQELRLASSGSGPINWSVGGFYQEEDVSFSNVTQVGFAPPRPAGPTNPATSGAQSFQDASTLSLFGTASYDVTDRLTANLGLRYIEVEKTVRQSPLTPGVLTSNLIPDAPGFNPVRPLRFETESRKDDDFLPSFDFVYTASDSVNLYGSYSSGFKAGGYSLANPPTPPAQFMTATGYIQTFDPETVDAFELGAKGSFFEGRVDANLAVFHAEYNDRQVSSLAESSPGSSSLTQSVANAATSTTKGIELDFKASLSDSLSVMGEFTLLDSAFDEFPNAPCYTGQTPALGCVGGVQDQSGRRTTYAPEYAGHIGAEYIHYFSGMGLKVQPSVDFSDGYILISDSNPINFQDGYHKFNLRVALSPDSENWELAVIARNLNDKKTSHFCQESPAAPSGSASCSLDRPRTVAIQGRVNF